MTRSRSLTTQCLAPLLYRDAGDSQRHHRIEPPDAKERVGEQADENSDSHIAAEEVLRALADGGRRPELRPEPPLRKTERLTDRERGDGQADPEPARFDMAAGHELLHALVGDERGEDEELRGDEQPAPGARRAPRR